jgi:murein tripeptide amidase MpaA
LDNDAAIIKILNQFDLHFLVMMNPDGYRYSFESPVNNDFLLKKILILIFFLIKIE